MATPPPPATTSQAAIRPIDAAAVHRICSGQVVLDLATAVKELVENALDAGATAIEVRLTDSGADLIEVADNGRGIPPSEHASLGRKHHTSKLRAFADLAAVSTFGFRGEALASLCAVAEAVTLVTRPAGDETGLATRLAFDAAGRIVSSEAAARAPGTTVCVRGLFAPLPVRRRELARTLRREYGRALAVLQAYALARPDVRLVATNSAAAAAAGGGGGGRTTAVASAAGATRLATFASLFGPKAAATLVAVDIPLPEDLVPGGEGEHGGGAAPRIVGYVSSGTAERARAAGDRQFFYVNGRPVDWPAAARALNEAYRSLASPATAACRPSAVLDFRLPRAAADVNVTPDKRKVFLAAEARVLAALAAGLARLWEPARSTYTVRTAQTQMKTQAADRRASVAGAGPKRARVEEEEAEEEEEEGGAPSSSSLEGEGGGGGGGEGATPAPPPERARTPAGAAAGTSPGRGGRGGAAAAAAAASPAAAALPSLAAFALGGAQPPAAAQATPVTRRTRERGGAPPAPAVLSPAVRRGGRRADRAPAAEAAAAAAPAVEKEEETLVSEDDDDSTDMDDESPAAPAPEAAPPAVEAARPLSPDECEPPASEEEAERMEEAVAPPAPAAVAAVPPSPPAPAPEPAADAAMEVDAAATTAAKASPTPPPPPSTRAPHAPLPPVVVRVDADDLRARFEARWAALRAKAEAGAGGGGGPAAGAEAAPAFHAASLAAGQGGGGGGGEAPPPPDRPPAGDDDDAATLPPVPADPTDAAASELERVFDKAEFSGLAAGVVGQFNLGFILALAPRRPSSSPASSTPPGRDLFIIDQHASDEKANFERLGRETVFGRQPLLAPVPLDLAPSEALAVREHAAAFAANGFEIAEEEGGGGEDGAPGRLLLTAVPTSRGVVFGEADVQELAAELAARPAARAGGAWPPRPARVRALLASRACRSSIMIGRPLGLGEQRRVVAALAGLDSPWNCPHGRPTMRHLAVIPPAVGEE